MAPRRVSGRGSALIAFPVSTCVKISVPDFVGVIPLWLPRLRAGTGACPYGCYEIIDEVLRSFLFLYPSKGLVFF